MENGEREKIGARSQNSEVRRKKIFGPSFLLNSDSWLLNSRYRAFQAFRISLGIHVDKINTIGYT
jgi:hypothetical protein